MTDARFGRESRLTDKSSYDRVFQNARRSRDRFYTVLCRANGRDEARLGLAIGRKHCKPASGRNRLKRIVRESFRHNRESLGGLDIVVINQPGARQATNAALFDSLDHHWRRCAAARHREKN